MAENATDSDRPAPGPRSLLREPLLHFLLLAAVLFWAQALLSGDSRELIVVDAATQSFLIQQREDLLLRPLTREEKEGVVESYIEEEILVREAKARGFMDNSRIRRLLIQNMRFFLASDLPAPTEEDLRQFFDTRREEFASPPSVDLQHVLFKDADKVPGDTLERLNRGADPTAVGDLDVSFGPSLRSMSQRQLVSVFGPDGAREILAVPEGDSGWRGPIVSPRGSAHFVRIDAWHPSRLPEFENASGWVEAQWLSTRTREIMDRELAIMRESYRVEVEPTAGAADE